MKPKGFIFLLFLKKVLRYLLTLVYQYLFGYGGLPKWLKGTVLKTVRRLCRAWVQIPHPPLVWSIGAVVYLASLSRRRSWVQIPYGPLMAELVKGLTHWFVDPACVGSIPTFRPIMEDQLSWESICLTSRRSQVRALYPPYFFTQKRQKFLSNAFYIPQKEVKHE